MCTEVRHSAKDVQQSWQLTNLCFEKLQEVFLTFPWFSISIILPFFFFSGPSLNWFNCKISVLFWHYRIRRNRCVSRVVDVFWMVGATQAFLKEYQVIGEKAGGMLLVHIHTTYKIRRKHPRLSHANGMKFPLPKFSLDI